MKIDEFNGAVDLIVNELQDMKSYGDFMDFDRYYEYARNLAAEIQKKCHENEFFNTHNIDRFASIIISWKMRLPTIDLLYNFENNGLPFNMETETMCDIQRHILNQIFSDDD
jgi:hypothetical protein